MLATYDKGRTGGERLALRPLPRRVVRLLPMRRRRAGWAANGMEGGQEGERLLEAVESWERGKIDFNTLFSLVDSREKETCLTQDQ